MSLSENTSTPADVTTDAQFRTFFTAVRAAITGAGLTVTSDTGQIDLTTVLAPAVSNYAGYDIFQFTDSEQSTDPIYFKLEYGKGAATTRAAMRLTMGNGTDGAGTILNPSSVAAVTPTGNANGNAYIGASFFSGAFVLAVQINASGATPNANQMMFVLERLRDLDGALVTNEYILGYFGNTMAAYLWSDGYWVSTPPETGGPSSVVSGVSLFDTIKLAGIGIRPFWFRSVLMAPSSLSQNDSGSVEVDGASRTYKRLAYASQHTNTASQGYAVVRSA